MKKLACMNCGAEPETALGQLCHPQTDALVTIDGEQVDVKLTDCEFMAKTYPETFRRPSKFVCDNVPVGMMLKVIVEWPIGALPTERFWVEVTSIVKDQHGNQTYFGQLRNRTLLADYDETIGPIHPRNVADVDLDAFIKKHELIDAGQAMEGAR